MFTKATSMGKPFTIVTKLEIWNVGILTLSSAYLIFQKPAITKSLLIMGCGLQNSGLGFVNKTAAARTAASVEDKSVRVFKPVRRLTHQGVRRIGGGLGSTCLIRGAFDTLIGVLLYIRLSVEVL